MFRDPDLDQYTSIVFDCKEMKPGCVLLQAVHGIDPGVAHYFHSQQWLINPTPDMHVYPLKPGMLKELVAMVEERHPYRSLMAVVRKADPAGPESSPKAQNRRCKPAAQRAR